MVSSSLKTKEAVGEYPPRLLPYHESSYLVQGSEWIPVTVLVERPDGKAKVRFADGRVEAVAGATIIKERRVRPEWENYGKILTAQRPEFRDRYFRCTYGIVNCEGIKLELFLFPDEGQRNDFLEVIAGDPWWLVRENAVLEA